LKLAEDETLGKAKAYRSAKYHSAQARASASKTVSKKKNTSKTDIQSLLAGAPQSASSVKKEEPGFWDGVGEALQTPVIKGIIDGISTPLYAVSNTLSNVQMRQQDAINKGKERAKAKGQEDLGDLGNKVQTMFEGMNPGTVVADTIKGVGQGLSAGVGNENDTKTTADLIKQGQKFNNIDTNDSGSKGVQFWGGLAGDIALDPLNAVGLGLGTSAIKGATRGSKAFKEANALKAKEGVALPEHIEPTQWSNAKKQAKTEMDKYRQEKLDVAQAKVANKDFKKLSPSKQAEYLVDNITNLRPAVARALVKTSKKNDEVLNAVLKMPESKMESAVAKLDDTTPDIHPADISDATPRVNLASVKPPTMDEKLFDVLGRLRTTDKTPRYDAQTIKNVDDAFAARAVKDSANSAGNVPDVKGTISAIRAFDKEMGGMQWPYKTADGKRYTLTTEDMINNLDPKDAKFLENFEKLDPEFKVYKTGKSKVNDEALRVLGVREEDIALLKQGVKLGDITDEISVGSIKAIARDIANGSIPDAAIKPFYEIAGVTDRAEIAKFIETASQTESFKKAATTLSKYGSHRTGEAPLPHLGVSGHGMQAIPGRGFTEDDILSAKTPANPEQSRKYLESKYNESALALAGMKDGAQLRTLADRVFESTIDTQRKTAGPLRTKRGASVSADKTKAKFETKYNTMSATHRIDMILREVRVMNKGNRGATDAAFMAVLKDVDDRLRLAGFDPHLTNMRIMGDKLVVRLAPSDVFGALTKQQRIDWIHGNPNSKGTVSREMLPSTVLDVSEVLVRSATRLKADGTLDFEALATNALRTLEGKFDSLGRGKREIGRNLDAHTALKNDQEILRALDKATDENFATLHRNANMADKAAVVTTAMAKHPAEFKAISMKRLDTNTLEIFNALTKGLKEGRPGFISEMVNTNMRNASVFGGSVAKAIGEASADYTAKVLAALDSGTSGDFLSALVTKPPFEITDDVARQLVSENVAEVQAKLIPDPQELAHAKASAKPSAKPHEAYQKDTDLLTEMSKPVEQQNVEKLFDLSIRERNRDLLWRQWGPSRFFNKRAGMQHSFETISNSSHAASLLMTGFQAVIRSWRAKGITSEQLRVAMNAIKNDLPDDAISGELRQVMNGLFDSSKMNFLDRNSIGPYHFNKMLESVGFDDKFRVPVTATSEEMMNAWKSWPITHVEDFLSKMMRAMTKTAEDVSMGASYTKHFGVANPTADQIAKEHLVKLVDKSKKGDENPFFPLIDQTLYYPKEAAEEIVHIGRLMTESRSFKPGTKLHTFVTKVMDPVISTLKMTQTTMKPGHHVMSVIGDSWRNQLALSTIGLNSPAALTKLYGESYRILHSAVGEIDELSAFEQFGRIQSVTSDLKVGSTRKGGFEVYGNIAGGGRITHNDLYAIMQAKGVALPQHLGGMMEDFTADFSGAAGGTGSRIVNAVDKTASGVDRLMNPLKPKFGMKNPYSVNKFTANRDTWTRGVMFLGAMRSRNFKSVDEATEYAANFVKKWSPTAVDLGGFETKYARRAIFYYTWMRGMIPRVIEGTLMRPGVALIPSKAMYNLGQANGLDLNSMGDPFPPDTLMPSWYSQKVLGPQWEAGGDLWGFNPTGPLGDVMNSLGSGISPKDFTSIEGTTKIAGTFLNMSTPWFKAPMELISGTTLQSGAPIADRGQYLQDMIGPLRTLSRATGKETFLGVGPDGIGIPNRTEKKYHNGMDGQQTMENALPELLNWASGMQFTNYTSDSASNSAYYQEKQKSLDKSKNDQRFG
jgi:hypothetical protein